MGTFVGDRVHAGSSRPPWPGTQSRRPASGETATRRLVAALLLACVVVVIVDLTIIFAGVI
jgi:hypothetical protein